MKYLITGLGNIGAEYAETRHNIGFKVVDTLAAATGSVFSSDRYGAITTLRHRGPGKPCATGCRRSAFRSKTCSSW